MAAGAIASLVIAAVSMAYQSHQKRKAEKKAKKDADARKGYDLSVEGESQAAAVVYGRTKLAGSRVFHKTTSSYVHATPPANNFGSITGNRSPGKNGVLYMQQVLCQGSLNRILDITLDGLEKDDPKVWDPGYRINCYPAGNQADPMMAANCPERSGSVFTNAPYLSMAFILNRDDPQFGGPPEVAAYVEGALVRTISLVNGVPTLSASKVYTNNPSYCLLDYLMSKEYGRGLEIVDIDLESFYNAAQVCAKIVQFGAGANGRIWKALGSADRNLPLYECNMVIDSSVPVRENIIDILTTMGDADLVWSGGRYKLQLQYPAGLGDVVLAGVINDDDLARKNISVKYPSASERANLVTIKYADEANDFKENSATWPPRGSPVHTTLLAEDNQVPLEKSYSEPGIVDSYHALAKAEELCRVSRSSVTYEFSILLSGIFYEPGDILLVNSEVATITNEYLKITEITVTEESTADIKAIKFDPYQLAWNAKDDEIVPPRNNYDFTLSPVLGNSITFTMHPSGSVQQSLGTLSWAIPVAETPMSYIVEVRRTNTTEYVTLGTTNTNSMEIYSLKSGIYEFSVRAVYSRGRRAAPGVSPPININALPAPTNVVYSPSVTAQVDGAGTVTWTGVNDIRVAGYNVYVHKVNDLDVNFNPIFTAVGTTTKTRYVLPALETTNIIVGVTSYSERGSESEYSLSGTITIVYPTPPAPITVTGAIEGTDADTIRVKFAKPANRADGSVYNDHSFAIVYRRRKNTTAWTYLGETSVFEYVDRANEYGDLEYSVTFVSTRAKEGPKSATLSINFPLKVTVDLTPPPAPFGLKGTGLFGGVLLEWQIPNYTIGRGHGRTLIYAKKWPEGETKPSFQETNLVASEELSSMHVFNANLGERWVFWAKEMSMDRGVSTAFAGPVDVKIGLVGNSDLADAIVDARNIADNSISNQKFIPGLEGIIYSTATTLPTAKSAETISWQGKLYKWDGTKYVPVVRAADFDGQLVANQIADGAVNTAKFATGIEPVTVVTGTLPTVKSTSTILFNGSLYKWSGTAYVSTILAANAVVTAAIADAALTTAKFAAGIEPITIVNGTLPTVKSTTTILFNGILYKWNGSAYVADVIADGSVTTAKVADGALNTAKFAAGIEPVTVVSGASLPTVKSTTTIYWNGSLYRWNGTAYASDILADGAVTATQIANAAITTAKFAAGIEPVTIVTGTLPTVKSTTTIMFNGSLYRWNGSAYTPDILETGSIVAGMIADGAVNTAKFANGIEPVAMATGAALPTVKSTTVIYWSGSLYRWNGVAYTPDILANAAVTAQQIADGAVNTAKFALGIEPVTVFTSGSLPTTKSTTQIMYLGKLYRWSGSAYVADVLGDNAVTANTIAANAVTAGKIAAGAVTADQIAAGAINAGKIAAGSITTDKIAANAVTANEIAAATITATEIKANTITAGQIAAGTLTATEIAANAITSVKINAGAITTAKIAALAVTANEIAAEAITAAKIKANTITAAQIAAGAISATEIAAGAITTAKIAASAITANEIAALAITTAKIAAEAVTATQIKANTITAGQIAAGAITANEIAAGAITTAKIAAGAITANEIAALAISTGKIAAEAVTAAQIKANTITAGQIAAGAISATEIAANAITTAKIAAGAVTATELAANSVTAIKIAAGTITADKLAADSITAGQIAAGAINTSELAAGAVNASKIAANTITANEIAANAITAVAINANAVTTAKIATGAVTANEIAANAITAAKIAAGAITADKLAAGSIVAGSAAIADGAISNAMIGLAAITTAKIADGSINSAKIADASITNAKIVGTIASSATDIYGRPLWSLDKTGEFVLSQANSVFRRDMRANYDRYWYMPTGVLVIEIGELT